MAGILFHVGDSTPAGIGGIDEYTVLMMHMDGDQSDSQHTAVLNGSQQLSTAQSKFGSSSLYVGGTTGGINIVDSPDWDFGTGNFTIDFWFRAPIQNSTTLFSRRIAEEVAPFYLGLNNTPELYLYSSSNGSTWDVASNLSAGSYSADTWTHIAIVRNGNDYVIYNQGVVIQTLDVTGKSFDGNQPINIGVNNNTDRLNGYIDEFRISKGVARWTADFSGNLPSVSHTSDSYTKLLLHFDGDVSDGAHVVTSNGNPQLNAATTKFDGAMSFDGNGDYLSIPDHANWSFGSGDFTIDFWVNFNSLSSQQWFVFQWPGGTPYWIFYLYNGQLFYTDRDGGVGGSDMETGAGVFASTGVWYHVAFVRNGSTPYIFIDGISQSLTIVNPFISTMPDISSPLIIGGRTDRWVDGYMDELRISKGIARWTSNFTPESGPYTI
ncbi:MAG: hypothetical protein DRI98_08075 [Bacteroidetes bacterium]|nr:MAG: hypothetical protein DRI98_08075 [Bacteroidota bacterium]